MVSKVTLEEDLTNLFMKGCVMGFGLKKVSELVIFRIAWTLGLFDTFVLLFWAY